MAFITADRVKDTSTTTGTGNITVSGGAPIGYRTFSTVLSVSDTFYYCVQGQGTSEWEVGLGTYVSSNQFSRTTVLASSASGSAVSFSAGTKNVFITLPANKTLQFDATGTPTAGGILYGTGSMLAYSAVGNTGQFLKSNGNAAPTWADGTSGGVSTISNGTSNVNIASSNGAVTIATNGTTAMSIDTSQNVGIGTTSPAYKFEVIGTNGIIGATGSAGYGAFTATGSGTNSSYIFFRNATNGEQARITSQNGGNLIFGNTNSATDRMAIDSTGNLLVGTTSSAYTSRLEVSHSGSDGITTIFNASTANNAMKFRNSNGQVGSIITNGSATSFNTSSDHRLKEDVEALTSGLLTVLALRPVSYKWKVDGGVGNGFIAHELQAIVPDAVSGEKDAVNEDGSIKPQGVDYSKIVVHLVAACQELSAKNDTLETRFAALEAK
jgi:hypothetical protein